MSVINTSTNEVVKTVTDFGSPQGVAITPNGTYAYVTNDSGTVSVIKTSTNTIVKTVRVGEQSRMQSTSPQTGATPT